MNEESRPLACTSTLPADVVALLPMRNLVLFPHVLAPVALGRPKSVAALQQAVACKAPVGLVLQKDAQEDDPGLSGLCSVGTLATVLQHKLADDGQAHAVCQGLQRIRIIELVEGYPFLAARIERLAEIGEHSTEAEALAIQLRERGTEILSLLPGVPAELAHLLQGTRSPSQLVDLAASLLDTELPEKQALLEMLDPEQNSTFRDNYLGVPFDLSRVLFIATANVIDNLPPPVRDRMEVIELPGYTLEDKLQIAQRYLLARQLQACGLRADQCELTEAALHAIATGYTREAGVRQFEREIGRVMRAVALRVAEGTATHVRVDAADLEALLGPPTVEHDVALRSGLAGVATGLAWTPAGGDILFIEATRVAGSGRLILTGQLGDVMKESAQAALTLVKSRAPDLGLSAALFEHVDVHVHVPAGAIPKDGPSAGVAMFIALASLFCDRPVRHDLAMTGEISLRGLVLPVGGIKEKVLAAQRAGLREVLLPTRNRKDLHDVPESTRHALHFTWLETVDDAITAALGARALAQEGDFKLV